MAKKISLLSYNLIYVHIVTCNPKSVAIVLFNHLTLFCSKELLKIVLLVVENNFFMLVIMGQKSF